MRPIQHWAGCASTKVILAVNTNGGAAMMTLIPVDEPRP